MVQLEVDQIIYQTRDVVSQHLPISNAGYMGSEGSRGYQHRLRGSGVKKLPISLGEYIQHS